MTPRSRAVAALALVGALCTACGEAGGTGSATMGDPAATHSPATQPSASESAEDSGGTVPRQPEAASAPGAATGIPVDGDGYAYRAPRGWVDITKQMLESTPTIDTAVGEPLAEAVDFRTNLNVIVTPDDETTLSAYEALAPDTLKFLAKTLDVLPRVTVHGQEAAHVSGAASSGGRPFHLDQFAVVGDGEIFTITFATAPSEGAPRRRALIASVLAGWLWA